MQKKLIDAFTIYEQIGDDADAEFTKIVVEGEETNFMDGFCWTMNRISKLPESVIRCNDCRLFLENWMCRYWHRFSRPEGYCHNVRKRDDPSE